MIKVKPDPDWERVLRRVDLLQRAFVTKVTVTKGVVTKMVTGRPRKHGTDADRQRAYRARKKAMA